MDFLKFIFQFLGALSFILYGMKLMSGGIQKSFDSMLQKAVSSISKNKFRSLFTGLGVSVLLQSSAATASMGVSFVDAGILTLEQAVPLVFGANIGTTFMLWVIAFFGYSFEILVFALPVFAAGFLLRSIKKIGKENIGEAMIGFALLFIGVNWLNTSFTDDIDVKLFFDSICGYGRVSILIGILAGLLFTALVNSSSLSITVVIALAYCDLIEWPMSVSLVLGTEIGSTANVLFSARRARLTGKRVAFIHVLFNIIISVLALILFNPLLSLVNFISPGTLDKYVVFHIAMLHSTLKVLGTIICFPIQKVLVKFSAKMFPDKKNDAKKEYKIEIPVKGTKESVAALIVRTEKEISDMAKIVFAMFDATKNALLTQKKTFLEEDFDGLRVEENYIDQMKEQLTHYIVAVQSLSVSDLQAAELSKMLQIVNDLEDMSDDCFTIDMFLKRAIEKNLSFEEEDLALLIPYTNLASEFLEFIGENIHSRNFSEEQYKKAEEIENKIDGTKDSLRRVARKRLENGSDVKSELLYIDIVRQIEKVGDRAFSISEVLKNSNHNW